MPILIGIFDNYLHPRWLKLAFLFINHPNHNTHYVSLYNRCWDFISCEKEGTSKDPKQYVDQRLILRSKGCVYRKQDIDLKQCQHSMKMSKSSRCRKVHLCGLVSGFQGDDQPHGPIHRSESRFICQCQRGGDSVRWYFSFRFWMLVFDFFYWCVGTRRVHCCDVLDGLSHE